MSNQPYLLPDNGVDPWSLLSAERARKAIAIRDFMLGPGRLTPDPDATLERLSTLFIDAGVPLDRCVTIVRILHSINTASYRVWEKGKGVTSNVFPNKLDDDDLYEESPSALAHRTRRWVRFNPQATPLEAFNLVEELRDAGLSDFICAPTLMANGLQNVFTFATRRDGGFEEPDIALLQAAFPAIEACQDILVTLRILGEVTRMYVGQEPHTRILAGDVRLGEVQRLRSAILYADMRRFTELTANMAAERATSLLNDYYDCIVPPVESRGGEVLKFIGDGILAIFRARADGHEACLNAHRAALEGLENVASHSQTAETPFNVGIGLHLGEVAYGNVGSGERLDYTVIGRDVNLAARLTALCGTINEPLIMSKEFQSHVGEAKTRPLGTYVLKGLPEPVAVFADS